MAICGNLAMTLWRSPVSGYLLPRGQDLAGPADLEQELSGLMPNASSHPPVREPVSSDASTVPHFESTVRRSETHARSVLFRVAKETHSFAPSSQCCVFDLGTPCV